MKRICVFCGSNSGVRPEYVDAARRVGALLANQGVGVVYGGARVGLMGAVADAALAAGGDVIGVMPEPLMIKEVAHLGLTELRVVGSMHERKALMAELSDAFVALPGGFGTLDELCEVLTWSQLGLYQKPCGILNIRGFFDKFLALLDHAVAEGFLRAEHRAILHSEIDETALVERLMHTRVAPVEKWIDRDQT
jgi:uncharacterized protein (TIGR00730 family)